MVEALSGVINARQPLPNIVTGGQPTEANFRALKEAGVTVVVDLREPSEPRPLDEPKVVAALGMEYVNIPIGPMTRLDPPLMERFLGVLRSHKDDKILVHCASANRVGGAMVAYLMLDHGMEQDDAVEAAQLIGLRSPDYLDWALAYVEEQRGVKGSGGTGDRAPLGARSATRREEVP